MVSRFLSLTLAFAAALALGGPGVAAAQSGDPAAGDTLCTAVLPAPLTPSDAAADYIRLAEVAGLVPVHLSGILRLSGLPTRHRCIGAARGPWPTARSDSRDDEPLTPAPARVRAISNSAYPRDRNNGALWAGRGVSVSARSGFVYRSGRFRAAVAPMATFSENLDFPWITVSAPGYSVYAHPWHTQAVDLPQRFGSEQRASIHPGDSYARYDGGVLSFGVSTETLWMGPARRNPVLMSNTAPGFPHVFAGTSRPLRTGIGALDVQAGAGMLDESEYWDKDQANDGRLITVFALTYAPRWVPGLHVGLSRVYHEIMDLERIGIDRVVLNLVDIPFLGAGSDRRGNEITSLSARWVFPEMKFEAYGEWTREEDPESLADFISEPDYSQGYMLGAQQILGGWPGWWRLWAEITHLAPSTPVLRGRIDAPYYTSLRGGQGHTHQGQVLGAWIGPGSETQAGGLDVFHRFGLLGVYLERVRFDDAAYYRVWARTYGESRHDAEVTLGARALLNIGGVEAAMEMAWSRRMERQFVNLDEVNWEGYEEHNRMIDVTLTWRP